MTGNQPDVIQAIVETFAHRPEVAAIALGGSHTSDLSDAWSDYDVSVYLDAEIPLDARRDLAIRFDPNPEIGNSWFGPCDEWTDRRSGVALDIMYWDRAAFERDLWAVIEEHRPALGYTTAFWRTVHHSTPLFDRDGWFAGMQELAATPYPEPLRRAIVAWNWPLLRTTHSSYYRQIELAIWRNDPVSVQHRLTALLASVFDIAFAIDRTPHPGEKRLLDHLARLEHGSRLAPRIRAVVTAPGSDAAASSFRGSRILSPDAAKPTLLAALDALFDEVDDLIRTTGLADLIDDHSRTEAKIDPDEPDRA